VSNGLGWQRHGQEGMDDPETDHDVAASPGKNPVCVGGVGGEVGIRPLPPGDRRVVRVGLVHVLARYSCSVVQRVSRFSWNFGDDPIRY